MGLRGAWGCGGADGGFVGVGGGSVGGAGRVGQGGLDVGSKKFRKMARMYVR